MSASRHPRVATGVDLIERARVLAAHARFGERFLRRVFTPLEREQAGDRIERLVGRFAAKEACAKMLGTGIGAVSWQEIEITRQPGGNPVLRLRGAAATRAAHQGLTDFDVSISDTATHTIAIVVGIGMA
ncbi:MAG TPA: holo-ACP synthase [Ktedonobacterales bacterium]|jgi:holo-[acyl-carrier protein] synthase|nr:holo-ACP synthase [Ktedonobacterales bacterium]